MALLAIVGVWLHAVGQARASLPDGRAWEMVSPLAKNGGEIRGIKGDNGGGIVQSAVNGEEITYVSLVSFGEPQGAPLGSQYVATRNTSAGWLTQNISTPTSSQSYVLGGTGTPYDAFSADLSRGLVFGGSRGRSPEGYLPVASPPLAGAPAGYENYYLDGIPGGALQPLLAKAPSASPEAFELGFLGATADLSHVVVRSPAVLGAGAGEPEAGLSNLYDWERATGQFQSVNILPGNLTAEVAHLVLLGGSGGATGQAVSEDGSRVIWTAESSPSALYVREGIGTSQPRTVQADAPNGGGRFLTASNDDTKVFFADPKSLTGDPAPTGGGLGDLYRFAPEAAAGGRLVDLTVDSEVPGGAGVQGVLGASADGSYLYFVANGVLASGAHRGDCSTGASPTIETCNLYLWHEGEPIRFIATLSGNDENRSKENALGVALDWDPSIGVRTARVSRDGTAVAFMSERSLTGYDNTVSVGAGCVKESSKSSLSAQCEEVFLYEASSNRLTCVSCNPTGAHPAGPSSLPGGTEFENNGALYQSRALSEGEAGSRVFFDSADALVPQDSNGVEDVYEYENGHVYLLSGGQSPGGASFVDASVSGGDVFFVTSAQLVSKDTDQLVDLYDARAPHRPTEVVGFPQPFSPPPCEGEDCRPAGGPPVPVFAPPSSVTFAGLGNVASTPSAKQPAKPKPKRVKVKVRKRKKNRKNVKPGSRAKGRRADKNMMTGCLGRGFAC